MEEEVKLSKLPQLQELENLSKLKVQPLVKKSPPRKEKPPWLELEQDWLGKELRKEEDKLLKRLEKLD